jgi:5-methylcytosine-specific restriction endonuclease McrA
MTEFTCTMPGCEVTIMWSGRGRHPKWCETHRSGRSARVALPLSEQCGMESCLNKRGVRGLCSRHYAAQLRAAKIESGYIAPTHCICGATIARTSSRGTDPKFCSQKCVAESHREEYARAEKAKREELRRSGSHICKWDHCGVVLLHSNKWCDEHRLAMARIHRDTARDKDDSKCSEMDCERPVRALGVCNMHYKRILRTQGRLPNSPWDERRRNNSHIRRARKLGTQSHGAVRVSDLIARDGLACGICAEPVDPALLYPNPFSRSVDHIMPIARGGAHTPENCQLAHLRCNVSKGDRVA